MYYILYYDFRQDCFWRGRVCPSNWYAVLFVVDVDEGEVLGDEGIDLSAGGGDAGGDEFGEDGGSQDDDGDSHSRAEGGDEFLGINNTGFGIVSEEDDGGKSDSNGESPLEKIWLRGDGAITLEIIDGKFEVRFRAEIVAA